MSLVDLSETYLNEYAIDAEATEYFDEIRHFAISGTELIVGPTIADDATLTMIYYATIPALTAVNTSNWLSATHPDLYLSGCLAEAFLLMEDTERAGIWDSRTVAKIQEVTKAGRRKAIGSAPIAPQGPVRTIYGVRA